MNVTYFAANKFIISGDYTSWFTTGRRVRLDCIEDGIQFGTVVSAIFSSPITTVTISESVLTGRLVSALIGISANEQGSLPGHSHMGSGADGNTLANYVRTDLSQNIRAQHTFDPLVQQPPFAVGTASAGQMVNGLNAEMVGGKTAQELQDLATYTKTISQVAHGFVIGDVLRLDESDYVKAQCVSSPSGSADVVGIVSGVPTADSFVMVNIGYITLSGLTAGAIYYLSPVTAGAYTSAPPSTPAEYARKPLFVALSTSVAFFFNGVAQVIDRAVIEFDNNDLTGSVLIWEHNLQDQYVAIDAFNGSNTKTVLTSITASSAGVAALNFAGMTPLSGTWHAVAR